MHRARSQEVLPHTQGSFQEFGPPHLAMTQEVLPHTQGSFQELGPPRLAMTQEVLPHTQGQSERSFVSRARSSPPLGTFSTVVSTKSVLPNPHTKQYKTKESRKAFRNEQLGARQNVWEIDGEAWMKMGKYMSQYSSNDQVTAEGIVENTFGTEDHWNPVWLKINGWTLCFWENKEVMLREEAGHREEKPIGWIDTRRAHGVSLEKMVEGGTQWFQVSLHFVNGHLRFRLKQPKEAQRWIDALHHVVYDRTISNKVRQDTEGNRRRRVGTLGPMIHDMLSTAHRGSTIVHPEQAMTLFRLYDFAQTGSLEVGELLLMVKEIAAVRKQNLIQFMEAHERSLRYSGQSFINGNTTGSAKHLRDHASYLLGLYETHLQPKRLVKQAIGIKETYDTSHDGKVDFKEFLPIVQLIVFPPEVIHQEMAFYQGIGLN